VLQRFKKFKALFISSNIPNSLLLEMVENFITSDDDDATIAEPVPILEGQLSLLDCGFCA
jgi:hypothetical protein